MIAHGVPWIHLTPAFMAVFCGYLYLKSRWLFLKIFLFFLWLMFLPNTIYIFTDLYRLIHQLNSANFISCISLIIQYFLLEIIGLTTYLLAMIPFESLISSRNFSKRSKIKGVIVFNFLIGFGMVLGKIEFVNSWIIFTHPAKIFLASIKIISSFDSIFLAFFLGVICNIIYFLFRSTLLLNIKRLSTKFKEIEM